VFQDLNLIYCDLLSRLVLATRLNAETQTTRSNKKIFASNAQPLNTNDKLWVQSDLVCDYIVGLLGGNESENHLARPLSPAAYNLLLPAIWSLINLPRRQESTFSDVNVWQTTLKHASSLSSKSALKRSTIDFVARIILV
jgi:pre-rRNA-processing protein IPI1